MNALIKISIILCLVGMASAFFPLKKVYLLKVNKNYGEAREAEPSHALFEKNIYVNHHHHTHHTTEKRDIPYTYEYGVEDHKTGDYKSAWERNDGHNVVGGYTLKEADGSIRVVNYKADPLNGFTADVKHIGKHS